MTTEASLEAVNNALATEVRKLQNELKQADKEIIDISRQLNIMRMALTNIANTERDSCSEWFQDVAISALTKAGER